VPSPPTIKEGCICCNPHPAIAIVDCLNKRLNSTLSFSTGKITNMTFSLRAATWITTLASCELRHRLFLSVLRTTQTYGGRFKRIKREAERGHV
jgi:hypothetical protein